MRLKQLPALILVSFFGLASAQNDSFYATMDAKNASDLKNAYPQEVEIYSTENNQSALKMSKNAAEFIHKNVLTHGPGYVFKSTKDDALKAISVSNKSTKVLNFTITEDALVAQALPKVDAENIRSHIQTLQNYGNRRHNTASGRQSSLDLRDKWQSMITASGRSDISVRLVPHTGTTMNSVVLTIEGQSTPSEFVIVGGHLDTTAFGPNTAAPGADDDASGIATITEMFRVLLDLNYKPQRTIEFMAFAAEEIGLVGSSEIATSYANQGKNVIAFVQFDMVNYKGSQKDIYFSTDDFVSTDLNLFLIELIAHYNTTGNHVLTYGNTICNYGCSDHYSFASKGYDAAFPFEASFNQSNPYIHSANDTLANMGNSATHAAKFAKLGLEFIIEASKSYTLATENTVKNDIQFYTNNNRVHYNLAGKKASTVQVIDITGKVVLDKHSILTIGTLETQNLPKGVYLAVFRSNSEKPITKKFVIK